MTELKKKVLMTDDSKKSKYTGFVLNRKISYTSVKTNAFYL